MTGKEMLIGATDDEIVVATLDDKNGRFFLNNEYYDNTPFSAEEGEERARESLEDGEYWKSAVAANQTEKGLNDWVEEVLSIDGWENQLGDISEIKDGMYVQMDGIGGAFRNIKPKDFTSLNVPSYVVDFIWKLAKRKQQEYTEQEKAKLEEYFNKYKGGIAEFDSKKEGEAYIPNQKEPKKVTEPTESMARPIKEVIEEYKQEKRMRA